MALAIVLSLIDAVSDAFELSQIQFGLILGSVLALLSVEAGKRLLGG